MEQVKLYEYLLNKYEEKQLIVAIEEMSELTKEITKSLRGKTDISHLLEEYVDVVIMLEQVKIYYGLDEEKINKVKEQKLKRTEERLVLL